MLMYIFVSVSWTLLRSPGPWNKFDLDCILGKGDQLFKFICQFRYLGIEAYQGSSTVQIVNSVQQVGTGAILIVKNYLLDLI